MVFKAFKNKFLHSCVKNDITLMKKSETNSHKTEQRDNPPLRYVTVRTNICNVFVLLASCKR